MPSFVNLSLLPSPMPSPARSHQENREPNLSIEEFGHLIQSAFDSQTIKLGFQNQPHRPSHPRPHIRIPDQPSRSSSVQSLSSTFKWLGPPSYPPRTPPTPSSPSPLGSSSYLTRSLIPPDKTRQSPSGPRHAKSMFGTLRTKLSFERLPLRRQPSIPSSPLFHSITPSEAPPPLPRPAPFFYSRSRSRLAAPDSPQNDSSGPSEVSVDSDEIKSWKKSQSQRCA